MIEPQYLNEEKKRKEMLFYNKFLKNLKLVQM